MSNGIGVYKIGLPSGSVYVGMTTRSFSERWKNHRKELLNGRHPCVGLVHAYRKYGIEALSFEVLEEVSSGTADSVVLKKEQEWWDRIKAQGVNIYNGRPSGTGSVQHTEETKARMVEASLRNFKLKHGLDDSVRLKRVLNSSNGHFETTVEKACATCGNSFFGRIKVKNCSKECVSYRKQELGKLAKTVEQTHGVTEAILRQLYEVELLSRSQIASRLGVHANTVRNAMRRYNIEARRYGTDGD